MALVNRRKISLYDEAKAGLDSLVKQTAQVFVGLLVMLLVTGGKPPAFVVSLSFFLGVGFVAWSEKKRLTDFEDANLSNAPETLVDYINKRVDDTNKRAVLRAVIKRSVTTLLSPDYQKLEDLSQQVVEAETEDFLELVKIVGLNLAKDFAGADLSFTNLSGADLNHANLSHANLSGADLSHAKLNGADLSHAKLSGADLSDANLSFAKLSGADLSSACLIGGKQIFTNLLDADLSDANLSDANLSDTNLSRANLNRTMLYGAKLILADLSDAKVKEARFGWNLGLSEGTKLDLKQRGAIFEDSPGDRSGVLSPR